MNENINKLLYIISFLISTAFSLIFIIFFVGEGGLTVFIPELIPNIIAVIIATAGIIYTLKNKKTGSFMLISGGLIQGIYMFLMGGTDDLPVALAFSLPYIIPGYIIYLIYKREKADRLL